MSATPGDQTSARSTGCGRARRVRSRFRWSHRSKGIPRLCSRAAPEGSETEGMERRCHGPPRLPLGSRQSRARASPGDGALACRARRARQERFRAPVRPLWAPARGSAARAVTGTPPRATSTGRTRIVERTRQVQGRRRLGRLDVFDFLRNAPGPIPGLVEHVDAVSGATKFRLVSFCNRAYWPFLRVATQAFARRRRTCCPTGPCSSPTRARRSSSVTRRRTWTCSWTTTCGTSSPRTLKSLTTRPTANAPSEPSCGG